MKSKQLKFITLTILLLLQIGVLKAQGWEEIYPQNSHTEVTYSIKPTQGGGYLMAGFSAGISGDTVGVVTLLNNRGEEQHRILNSNTALEVSMYFDLEITPDGGFIVTGVSRNFGSGIYEPYFAKYDAVSVWRLDDPLCVTQRSICLTNRFRIWMRRCGWPHGLRSHS